METWIPQLTILLPSLPIVAVWLVGLLLAILRWKKTPFVCLLAVGGLFLQLLVFVFGNGLRIWLMASERPAYEIGRFMGSLAMVVELVRAVGWGLIIAAIFVGRTPPTMLTPPQPQ